MSQVTAARPPDTVRVVVEDEPGILDRVREAARLAQASDRALELVEPSVPASDHEARARMIRHMDEALHVARCVAPGLPVWVGATGAVPAPRRPT